MTKFWRQKQLTDICNCIALGCSNKRDEQKIQKQVLQFLGKGLDTLKD
jgi:hypothetical protein